MKQLQSLVPHAPLILEWMERPSLWLWHQMRGGEAKRWGKDFFSSVGDAAADPLGTSFPLPSLLLLLLRDFPIRFWPSWTRLLPRALSWPISLHPQQWRAASCGCSCYSERRTAGCYGSS